MHIETAKRILRVADRIPKAQARKLLKQLAEAYIFRLEIPTYTLTRRQLARAMSEAD